MRRVKMLELIPQRKANWFCMRSLCAILINSDKVSIRLICLYHKIDHQEISSAFPLSDEAVEFFNVSIVCLTSFLQAKFKER